MPFCCTCCSRYWSSSPINFDHLLLLCLLSFVAAVAWYTCCCYWFWFWCRCYHYSPTSTVYVYLCCCCCCCCYSSSSSLFFTNRCCLLLFSFPFFFFFFSFSLIRKVDWIGGSTVFAVVCCCWCCCCCCGWHSYSSSCSSLSYSPISPSSLDFIYQVADWFFWLVVVADLLENVPLY